MSNKPVIGGPSQEWRRQHSLNQNTPEPAAPVTSGREEIDALILEWNTTIIQAQTEILTELYRLMRARPGYKKVCFGRIHAWTSIGTAEERLELPVLLRDLIFEITDIVVN